MSYSALEIAKYVITSCSNQNQPVSNLKDNIFELSEGLLDKARIRDTSLKLLEIYRGDFRHSCSNFFQIIVGISKD